MVQLIGSVSKITTVPGGEYSVLACQHAILPSFNTVISKRAYKQEQSGVLEQKNTDGHGVLCATKRSQVTVGSPAVNHRRWVLAGLPRRLWFAEGHLGRSKCNSSTNRSRSNRYRENQHPEAKGDKKSRHRRIRIPWSGRSGGP
jgi:hypothetical protein